LKQNTNKTTVVLTTIMKTNLRWRFCVILQSVLTCFYGHSRAHDSTQLNSTEKNWKSFSFFASRAVL